MFAVVTVVGDRYRVLTDRQWELLELLLPKSEGRVGRNFCENRRIVEGMLYRLRTGVPWRDLPGIFGLWQTVWKRHRRYATERHLGPGADRAARAGRHNDATWSSARSTRPDTGAQSRLATTSSP
ncbi:transposase [Nocardia nova]|uniref:transposase n=1 Tax=Nocardia nova TaxID=37330 RepID=UPI003791E0E3